MTPSRTLTLQSARLSHIRDLARALGRPDIALQAREYSRRLENLSHMCGPDDASYLAGQLGPNGIGPAIDDMSKSVKRERQIMRRTVQTIPFILSSRKAA